MPAGRGGKHDVRHFAARIGQQDLLGKPDGEHGHAAGEFLDRMRARLELVGHVAEPDDRAGDELREHADEAGEVDEAPDRARLAAIDVNRVAHRLEGVEADAERQRHAQGGVPVPRGQAERCQQGVVILEAEVEVLEESQERQVADHRHRQGELLASRSRTSCRQEGNLACGRRRRRSTSPPGNPPPWCRASAERTRDSPSRRRGS